MGVAGEQMMKVGKVVGASLGRSGKWGTLKKGKKKSYRKQQGVKTSIVGLIKI